MRKAPLWQFSATEIATATHAGALTATEATEAAIARMEAINPSLNAVVDSLADTARAEATALDAMEGPKGPLHGVPVTIKINVDQKGSATSNGVLALKDMIAPDDAPVVRNLKAAGAIVIGRSNTPEFSFRADTDNPLFGRTHNPWGKHVSAGGSSGGAGSAVMAGIGALAHGNDIGGSLRFPASANGAVTVKPGLGRVPAYNPSQKAERGLLAQSMSVQGLLARNAADLALSMPALIAPDPRDPFHVPMPWHGAPLQGPIRVAVSYDDFGFGLHPEVATALDKAASALSDAGYIVEAVEPPMARETGEVGYRALLGEVQEMLGPDIKAHGSADLNTIFDEYYLQFPPYEGKDLLVQMAQRTHYARAWSLFLEDYPLVLTPFLLKPFFAPARDEEGAEGVLDVLGAAHWSFIMNFLGLPAGNLPTHIAQSAGGAQPIGVQIAGRRWREDLIVDAMQAIEKTIPPVCETLWKNLA
ncbi:amidase [Sulfitobacter donghicola]|uniref:Amidase n=1 Tax=Sulfitobacter donghicola DSW-25 = KCTC 12864 = JCM 14565 TaxID=1300350 RepID=A0A073IR13_9RHOB|nr:amidase [Sulfitobacter donghicola]KEJ87842.1 amidase [Sulfitobacter donghicola DSW-25 = KCTC 12864 = JCM 14565]KIN60018.1 Amidase [Sulfitobacter donghicola DSW-25 = KCTC 12864 = JCM 14565]